MDNAILYLTKKDAVLKNIVENYGQPFIPSRPQGFQTLCKLIIEQQVSLASAKACYLKLERLLVEVTPQKILKTTIEELRMHSVSRPKATYLIALSEAIISKQLNLELLVTKTDLEIRNELIQIKGIGNWTIDIYLMFALQRLDIIPLGDIAVKNTIKELYEVTTHDEIETISLQWQPYRSIATYILWHYYLEKRNRKPLEY